MEEARLNMDDHPVGQGVEGGGGPPGDHGAEGGAPRISRRSRGRNCNCSNTMVKNQRIKVLGRGSSGKACLVRNKEASELCAAKERKEAVEEAVLLKSMGHMSTVCFQGVLMMNGQIKLGTRPIPSAACARTST